MLPVLLAAYTRSLFSAGPNSTRGNFRSGKHHMKVRGSLMPIEQGMLLGLAGFVIVVLWAMYRTLDRA